MRLADKFLLCCAAIYTVERIAASFSYVSNWYAIRPWWSNIFLYAFLALALIEYAKLLLPRVQAWRARRRAQQTPENQKHTD